MIQVVSIESLSFTGTTWLNVVLGSAPGVFALGPPERAWRLRSEGFAKACLVHGPDCPFWSGFAERWREDESFVGQLAEHAGAHTIVLNNPSTEFRATELERDDVRVKPIRLIRDGRVVAASYVRKYPERSFAEAVADWLRGSYVHFPYDPDDADVLSLRYEDVEADKRSALERIGTYLGIDYGESALRFWEHEHHVTSGNQGLISMIRMGQALPVADFKGRAFYDERFAELQRDPALSFCDERWQQEITRQDRFVFDLACGAASARFGYPRDAFTLDEMRDFLREINDAVEAGTAPSALAGLTLPHAPAGTDGASGPPEGLRTQLRRAHLAVHGLRASPRQLKRLARFGVAVACTALAIAFLLGLLLGRLL